MTITDWIVKTNSEGKVETDRKGNAKTAIGGIEKGILKDGINLKRDNNIIDVGGKGQASVKGFEDFILKLSNYESVDKEIGGYYLSNKGEDNISHIYVGDYQNNTSGHANYGLSVFSRPDLVIKVDAKVDYHTHLSRMDDIYRLGPSGEVSVGGDLKSKRLTLELYPSMKFTIVTDPENVNY